MTYDLNLNIQDKIKLLLSKFCHDCMLVRELHSGLTGGILFKSCLSSLFVLVCCVLVGFDQMMTQAEMKHYMEVKFQEQFH